MGLIVNNNIFVEYICSYKVAYHTIVFYTCALLSKIP